jgi:hypothetical protein
VTDDTGTSGATPESGHDPAGSATRGGQETTSGATPAAGSTEGATPDTSLADAGRAALDKERNARRDAERKASEYRRRIDELEDAGKPELERATAAAQRAQTEAQTHAQRVAELEKQLADRDAADLRRKVAAEVGLPAEMADRLHGDDLRALRADATKLAETIAGGRPVGDIGIGKGNAAGGRQGRVDMNQLIREAAGRG